VSTGQRLKFWFAERFAMIVALLVLFYLFLPVLYTFVFSFNNYKKSNISWNPEGSPTLEHWQNPCGPPGLCESLGTSIKVGGIATLVATVLGYGAQQARKLYHAGNRDKETPSASTGWLSTSVNNW